jgi:hypothetical protein
MSGFLGFSVSCQSPGEFGLIGGSIATLSNFTIRWSGSNSQDGRPRIFRYSRLCVVDQPIPREGRARIDLVGLNTAVAEASLVPPGVRVGQRLTDERARGVAAVVTLGLGEEGAVGFGQPGEGVKSCWRRVWPWRVPTTGSSRIGRRTEGRSRACSGRESVTRIRPARSREPTVEGAGPSWSSG